MLQPARKAREKKEGPFKEAYLRLPAEAVTMHVPLCRCVVGGEVFVLCERDGYAKPASTGARGSEKSKSF